MEKEAQVDTYARRTLKKNKNLSRDEFLEMNKHREKAIQNAIDRYGKDVDKEWEAYVKKNPDYRHSAAKQYGEDPKEIWETMIRKESKDSNYTKRVNKLIDEFGKATLKDLGIEQNEQTVRYVNELIKRDPYIYKWA